jgi:hypothetical protein
MKTIVPKEHMSGYEVYMLNAAATARYALGTKNPKVCEGIINDVRKLLECGSGSRPLAAVEAGLVVATAFTREIGRQIDDISLQYPGEAARSLRTLNWLSTMRMDVAEIVDEQTGRYSGFIKDQHVRLQHQFTMITSAYLPKFKKLDASVMGREQDKNIRLEQQAEENRQFWAAEEARTQKPGK